MRIVFKVWFWAASMASMAAMVGVAPTSAADTEKAVYVYTNADLDQLPPVEISAPGPDGEKLGWDYVTDFIARERARIDADRDHALDRELVEAQTENAKDTGERYWIPGPGYGYRFYDPAPRPKPPSKPPLRGQDAYSVRTPPGLEPRPDDEAKQHKGRRPRG